MRVLVVEDEERLAASLGRGLEAGGFAVDVALDGTDGLWMARENDYDATVLDIMLPGVNGFQVCQRLRAADIWTPILMLPAGPDALRRPRAPRRRDCGRAARRPGEPALLAGEVEIPLTTRELSVLEFLVRHAGQVVSKRLTASGSSNGSPGSMTPGLPTPAGTGPAWPSCARSSLRTWAASASTTPPAAVPASWLICRQLRADTSARWCPEGRA